LKKQKLIEKSFFLSTDAEDMDNITNVKKTKSKKPAKSADVKERFPYACNLLEEYPGHLEVNLKITDFNFFDF
jgi:hypothetical protein